MGRERKKIAAITSAVADYLEQEGSAQSAKQGQEQTRLEGQTPWALAGRMEVMSRRYQMQLRVFR